jgi:hypothetical protein
MVYESLSSRHWQCATPRIKKRSKSPEEKKEAGLGCAVEVEEVAVVVVVLEQRRVNV